MAATGTGRLRLLRPRVTIHSAGPARLRAGVTGTARLQAPTCSAALLRAIHAVELALNSTCASRSCAARHRAQGLHEADTAHHRPEDRGARLAMVVRARLQATGVVRT